MADNHEHDWSVWVQPAITLAVGLITTVVAYLAFRSYVEELGKFISSSTTTSTTRQPSSATKQRPSTSKVSSPMTKQAPIAIPEDIVEKLARRRRELTSDDDKDGDLLI
ncbi:uncharacterized protein F4817DRAFT_316237 [Daldinia loculata]|uniref:uncharacterized protein n=1 Tax=Daldinia loculata TaxID=103429 RepID=UPI0020C2AC3D|nr:uncharacterized protein F4817DRAFT_316237 [Daldinia loculata]KAI1647145.1 hypothetical protein F4817DRAFT_316237 [Daldinia loculata]